MQIGIVLNHFFGTGLTILTIFFEIADVTGIKLPAIEVTQP
jgi:hypothetical protein